VNFAGNRNNLFIVAISVGIGMIPLVAPRFLQSLPHAIHPLIESGILLASFSSVVLNLYFNGTRDARAETLAAAKVADAH
jgi:uric acid transporter